MRPKLVSVTSFVPFSKEQWFALQKNINWRKMFFCSEVCLLLAFCRGTSPCSSQHTHLYPFHTCQMLLGPFTSLSAASSQVRAQGPSCFPGLCRTPNSMATQSIAPQKTQNPLHHLLRPTNSLSITQSTETLPESHPGALVQEAAPPINIFSRDFLRGVQNSFKAAKLGEQNQILCLRSFCFQLFSSAHSAGDYTLLTRLCLQYFNFFFSCNPIFHSLSRKAAGTRVLLAGPGQLLHHGQSRTRHWVPLAHWNVQLCQQ